MRFDSLLHGPTWRKGKPLKPEFPCPICLAEYKKAMRRYYRQRAKAKR